MSDSRGPTVVFLVPDGVHPLDLTGPAQVFYEAVALGASFELVFAGIEDRASMPSSMGLQFGGLQPRSALTLTDLIDAFVVLTLSNGNQGDGFLAAL